MNGAPKIGYVPYYFARDLLRGSLKMVNYHAEQIVI
jgi:hypothetical protein